MSWIKATVIGKQLTENMRAHFMAQIIQFNSENVLGSILIGILL